MKVLLYFTTGMVGGKREEVIEVTDEEVEDMGSEERENYLEQLAIDFMNNHIDFGFEVLDA
jgi:hypothetical protein